MNHVSKTTPPKTKTIPPHVPAHLVIDFDAFHPMAAEDTTYHAPYHRLQQQNVPPVFWSPYNGGHWIATRVEALTDAGQDYERFTSHFGASIDVTPADHAARPRLAPIELDPPRQQVFRELFSPAFVASALKAREDEARRMAIDLIEGFKAKGGCEFVTEFAQHLPIKVFMGMVDIPEEDRLTLLPLAQAQVHPNANKAALMQELAGYAAKKVVERRANPKDDLISKIATSEVDGEPIAIHDAVGVTMLLLIGGLDTVASMMGHVMQFLANSPSHRQELVENPALIRGAVEELLRRFALTNPSRTVTGDFDFYGAPLRKGDKIMLSAPFGALDPDAYDDPARVDFTRKSLRKTTFGAGAHVCPGSMLARVELRVLLEEWLPRIPEFTLDTAQQPRINTGVNGSFAHLPLSWAN